MNKLRSIFFVNRIYFTGYLLLFLGGLIFLLTEGKSNTFLLLNPYHVHPLDYFFTYFTWLGDGFFTVGVILLLIVLRRYTSACEVLCAFLLSALFAQIFKNLFSMPRPREFFNNGQYDGPYKHFIRDVTLHGFSSFPSGHSTSIFALVTMLAILEPNKRTNWLYLIGGAAVGYSRIYLGQHFLTDVLAGSFLGVLVSTLVHWLFSEKFQAWTGGWGKKGD